MNVRVRQILVNTSRINRSIICKFFISLVFYKNTNCLCTGRILSCLAPTDPVYKCILKSFWYSKKKIFSGADEGFCLPFWHVFRKKFWCLIQLVYFLGLLPCVKMFVFQFFLLLFFLLFLHLWLESNSNSKHLLHAYFWLVQLVKCNQFTA